MDKPKRYRKRPIIIEAIRWSTDNLQAVQDFVGDGPYPDKAPLNVGFAELASTGEGRLWVAANNEWLTIQPGEWVAKDSAGCYPIQEAIFATTYEEVEPAGELSN